MQETKIEFYSLKTECQVLPQKKWVHKSLTGWRRYAQSAAYWILDKLGSFSYETARIQRNVLTITNDLREAIQQQINEHHIRGGIIPEGQFVVLAGPDVYQDLLRMNDSITYQGATFDAPVRCRHQVHLPQEFSSRDRAERLRLNGYSLQDSPSWDRFGTLSYQKIFGYKLRLVPHMKGLLVIHNDSRGY